MVHPAQAIEQFHSYLQRRHYAVHTQTNYMFDLRLFFTGRDMPLDTISYRDIEQFLARQHAQGLAATTINRRLYALKHLFDYCLEMRHVLGNPVKPSHFARLGRPLPKALSTEHVHALFAQMQHPMDRALFLVMLRGGLRVSEIADLRCDQIDWEQKTLRIEQGKGRKDRRVYVSSDVITSLQKALVQRPRQVPGDAVFWNRKRPQQTLSIKAIQKKIERYAKAAGIKATCHQLRHTFASNLLEQGAEIVTIKELLGHESTQSSERYARVSNQRVKEEYQRTMRKVLRNMKV